MTLALANPRWKPPLQRGGIALVIWTATGIIFALPSLTPAGHLWPRVLLSSLAQWWAWGLLAPFIVRTDKALPFSNKQMIWRVAGHLMLCPVFTAIYLYLYAAVLAVMGLGLWSHLAGWQLLFGALRGMFFWSALVYWLVVGVWQAYINYRRNLTSELRMERLERSFSEARLNALRMQLDPHFLFNALNTISSQVEREPRLARQMIEHLGDLLRMSLENKDRQQVPLIEEIAFLEPYLAIQKIRFGNRLQFTTKIDADVRCAMVPCLVIQPLVENAIRHGLSSRAIGGRVVVSAHRIDDQLEIIVSDDGVGLPPGWAMESTAGLGLSVTRERVRGIHPEGSRFVVRRGRSGGTEAAITLPLQMAETVCEGARHGAFAD